MTEPTDEDFLAALSDPSIYALATQDPFSQSSSASFHTKQELQSHSFLPSFPSSYVLPPSSTRPTDFLTPHELQAAQRRRRQTIAGIEAALARWKPTLEIPLSEDSFFDNQHLAPELKEEALLVKKGSPVKIEETSAVKKGVSAMKEEICTVNKKASVVNEESSKVMEEVSAVKEDNYTARKDASVVKEEASTAKEEASVVKKENYTVKINASVEKDLPTVKNEASAVKEEPSTGKEESANVVNEASPSSILAALEDLKSGRKLNRFMQQKLNFTKMMASKSAGNEFRPDRYQAQAMSAARAGRSFFMTGSAGTGKSFVLKQIIAELRILRKVVAVTASTGCAAVGIGGGTIHSMAGIGLGMDPIEKLRRRGHTDRRLRERFQKMHTLVIDEISMIDSFLFDKIEAVIKAAREPRPPEPGRRAWKRQSSDVLKYGASWKDAPFGGLQVILCGDFFQLPPVGASDYKYQNTSVKYFAFESQAWQETIAETFILRFVHRQADRKFAGLLNELRNGVVSECSKRVINACMVGSTSRHVEADENGQLVHFTKLYSYRNQVAAENSTQLRRLRNAGVRFTCNDEILRSELGTLTVGMAQQMLENSTTCLPSVELKTGCRVLCVKNIDTARGICNGAAGIIVGWAFSLSTILRKRQVNNPDLTVADVTFYNLEGKDVMQLDDPEIVEFLEKRGRHGGDIVLGGNYLHALAPVVRFDSDDTHLYHMGAVTWEVNGLHGQVIGMRSQIPLILGWALSIHKSQGMTLEDVETDVGQAFDFGQVYVALSRATSIQKLRLKTFDSRRVKTHEKVIDYYKELETDSNLPKKRKVPEGNGLKTKKKVKISYQTSFDKFKGH